jgi:hypothetical protein
VEGKHKKILSLAAALSGLSAVSGAEAAVVTAKVDVGQASSVQRVTAADVGDANRYVEAAGEVMPFLVAQAEDGTVVAQHRSHYSHSSHSSHSSHHSSRF